MYIYLEVYIDLHPTIIGVNFTISSIDNIVFNFEKNKMLSY